MPDARRASRPDRPLVVVAHSQQTGRYYADQFGEPGATIVTRPSQLAGYAPGSNCPQIVVVNSDDGHFSHGVLGRLRILEAQGVDVDWLG